MNLLDAVKNLFTLQNLANIQKSAAEPFLRGVSPIPVKQLPGIGGNFHTPEQSAYSRIATGAGLGAQTLLGNVALAPLNIAKAGFAAKTLGPNVAKVAQRIIGGAKIGATLPIESPNLQQLLKDRQAGLVGGAISGGIGFQPALKTTIVALNSAGNNAAGFARREVSDPVGLARDIAGIGGGLAGYFGMRNR
jgi:hypothetical protein